MNLTSIFIAFTPRDYALAVHKNAKWSELKFIYGLGYFFAGVLPAGGSMARYLLTSLVIQINYPQFDRHALYTMLLSHM